MAQSLYQSSYLAISCESFPKICFVEKKVVSKGGLSTWRQIEFVINKGSDSFPDRNSVPVNCLLPISTNECTQEDEG